MKCMGEDGLITVASLIAGFGVAVIMFRLQRELSISDENWRRRRDDSGAHITPTWVPFADYLVIGATLIALIGGVSPLLLPLDDGRLRHAAAASAVATTLLAGYVPAILAHYRFIHWLDKRRPHFLIVEVCIVTATVIAAILEYRHVESLYHLCSAG